MDVEHDETVDLVVDLNTMDETGLPWTFLDEAADPSQIIPGAHVIAGSGEVRAVVVVVDVTPEGIVHVCDVPGSVASNAHLLETYPASRRLPDPVEVGGTGRDETASAEAETPGNTGWQGTRRHHPGRGSSGS